MKAVDRQAAANAKAAAGAAGKNPTLGDVAGKELENLKGSVKPTPVAKKELDSLALPSTADVDALLSELDKEDEQDAKIEAYKAEVKERTEKCVKLAKVVGKLLADEEDIEFNQEKISKAKSMIAAQLTSITRKTLQRQAAATVCNVLVETLPANDRGVEAICDYVVAVGLMKGVPPATAGCITATFENEEKKQMFRYLVSGGIDVPADVVKAVKEFVDAPSKALSEERSRIRTEYRKADRDFRRGTTGNLLEVLEAGEGETVIPAFDKEVGDGKLRVEVADGMITPVGVLGRYSELGNRMIEEEIAIPVASVGKERLELKEREKSRERFQLMVKLQRAVNFWFAVLTEQKGAIEKAKATGKWVGPHAFVVEKKVGVTYLFVAKLLLFDEKPLRNVHLVLERREGDGAIKVLWWATTSKDDEAFALNKEWKVPSGGRYDGLGRPLTRALQFSYGNLVRQEKIRKRKEAARLAREAEAENQAPKDAGEKPISLENLDDSEDDPETDETSDSDDASEEE